MSRAQRVELMKKIQADRGGRLCISYVTSTRTGHEIQIADDVLPLLHRHLEKSTDAAKIGVDLFLHSNGGSGIAPWRIVSLIREYTKSFAVLVPHRAFSAATITALGADEIVMHKMGCLGPIDPSVANVFNPAHPQAPGQLAPISVEDVTAFFKLVREEISDAEKGLMQSFEALTEKIHPLALGNVHRSHNQSRLLARKLLKMHMGGDHAEKEISAIIDNLKSNLFFHGHPINRAEATGDLKLKVKIPDPSLETLMWELYMAYEERMDMARPFSALRELEVHRPSASPGAVAPTTQEIVEKMKELAASGLGLGPGGLTEEQIVKMAAAVAGVQKQVPAGGRVKIDGMRGAYVESIAHTDVFKTDIRLERTTMTTQAGPQDVVKQEVVWQRWEEEGDEK